MADHPVDERRSPGPEADLSFGERLYLREAIKGMGVIANHFFRNLFGFRDGTANPDATAFYGIDPG